MRRAPSHAMWLKQLHQWHWISGALSLVGMLLFALTGITLNHAAQIPAAPQVTRLQAQLPGSLHEELQSLSPGTDEALPAALRDWLRSEWSLRVDRQPAEWSDDEIYLSLPRPGGDAWLSVMLDDGSIEYERTERGWIAWFNDLHKGRNTGAAWSWFIDLFALVCVVFSLTGLLLLRLHATRRSATWPLVGSGFALPALLALFFIH